jgi:hypothetical protein
MKKINIKVMFNIIITEKITRNGKELKIVAYSLCKIIIN